MTFLNALFLAVTAFLSQDGAPGSETGPIPAGHATPRLISATTSLVPGTTNEIGIHIAIERGWHIYWDGHNDSGMPLSAKWTLPTGYKAGPIRWPVPTRHVLPGDILDHVYLDEVTLIVPIEVPAAPTAGSTAVLSADLKWLECSTVCVQGEQTVALTLPVAGAGEKPRPAKEAGLLEKSRARIARPIPKDNPPVVVSWSEDRVEINAPGAGEMLFYPGNRCVPLADPLKDAQVKGPRMVLRLRQDEEQADRSLQGVLELRPPGSPSGATYYEVNSKPPDGR